MPFFTDISGYTHYARFYGVPCYMNLATGELAGRNIICEWLLVAATIFHNKVIERLAQLGALLLDQPYEPGFPISIKPINGELDEYDDGSE